MDDIRNKEDMADYSDILTSSRIVSSVNVLEVTSDMGAFFPDQPGTNIPCIEPILHAAVTNKSEAKIEAKEFLTKWRREL